MRCSVKARSNWLVGVRGEKRLDRLVQEDKQSLANQTPFTKLKVCGVLSHNRLKKLVYSRRWFTDSHVEQHQTITEIKCLDDSCDIKLMLLGESVLLCFNSSRLVVFMKWYRRYDFGLLRTDWASLKHRCQSNHHFWALLQSYQNQVAFDSSAYLILMC